MVKTSKLLRKINIREVKNNWPQFLAVIFIAFLAITLFSGLTSSWKTLDKRLATLNNDANTLDVLVYADNVSDTDFNYVKELPNVTTAERRLSISGNVNSSVIQIIVNEDTPTINKPVVKEYKKGVYLDKATAKRLNLVKGDTITVLVSDVVNIDEELLMFLDSHTTNKNIFRDDLCFSFVIDDLMYHPESTQRTDLSNGILSLTMDAIIDNLNNQIENNFDSQIQEALKEKVRSSIFFNQLLIKSDDADGVMNKLNSYYENAESSLIMMLDRQGLPSMIVVRNDIIQGEKLTYVFPVIFFIVSILVILTTTSQLIFRERTLIGSMKAIGVKDSEIYWHYMKFSCLLCLIGGSLGLIVGPLIIPNVMGIKYDILYCLPKSGIVFFSLASFLVLVIMLLIASLVSIFVSHHQINLMPAIGMRGENISIHNHKAINVNVNWSLKLALRNIWQKKTRALMVIIGLAGTTALFLAGFGITNTLNNSIDVEIYENFAYDISISYNINKQNAYEDIKQLGVNIEEYAKIPIKAVGTKAKDTSLYIIDEKSSIFKYELKNNDCIITKKISELSGVKKGEAINIIYGTKKYSFIVTDIFDSAITQGIFINDHDGSKIYSLKTNAWVKYDGNLEQMVESIEKIEGVSKAFSITTYRRDADDILGSVNLITITLKVFACLLAVVVLYNLALLNYKERSRDIATLKVIGYHDGEILLSIVIEMMTLTTIGGLIGLTLGMPILKLLLMINENEILTFIYHIKVESYLFSLGLTIITSFIVNLFLGGRIKKIPMVESLKSVE